MRTNRYFCYILLPFLFLGTTALAQSVNFDQTWLEFLENNKISKVSQLIEPDKRYDRPDYAKYLLMNTNSNFCQSRMGQAEQQMAEIRQLEGPLLESIPGFIGKMEELDAKIKAYHSMDAIWKRFLQTKTVNLAELDAITAAKTSCEKRTLAKYSFMQSYDHLCRGEVAEAKNIFENRTLRLTEQTTLRVADVEGLAREVAAMKSLFQDMDQIALAWNSFVSSGVSRGFNKDLPLFRCYPLPNIKAAILNGWLDLCNAAPAALDQIKQLQAESGITLDRQVAQKLGELEAAIGTRNQDVAILNEAWEAFIPDNKVKHAGQYGYDYCEKEPLIRAYIMDGFAYACTSAEEMLRKIDSIQRREMLPLEQITMIKINELAALSEQYQADGRTIERVWNSFVSQGDFLSENYRSADFYCDRIHQVKDWTIRGLSTSCEESHLYLDKIDEFQRTFEFNFAKDLECRVQKLRIKVWDCRFEALQKLARLEAPDSPEARLRELMTEYGMSEQRPAVCVYD